VSLACVVPGGDVGRGAGVCVGRFVYCVRFAGVWGVGVIGAWVGAGQGVRGWIGVVAAGLCGGGGGAGIRCGLGGWGVVL